MVKKLAMALALLSLVPLLGLTPQALLADEPEQSAPAASTNRQAVEMTPEDVGAWLDGLMPYALADGDIPGAVVTVVKDGKVLANKGYGYADLARRKPVDPDTTLFRIGSIIPPRRDRENRILSATRGFPPILICDRKSITRTAPRNLPRPP